MSCPAMESYLRDSQRTVANRQLSVKSNRVPSSTLISSQSDLLGPQDYRTAVPRIDINHTEFAQDFLIGLGIKFDEWPGITLKSL